MGRIDDRLADARARSGDRQQDERRGEPGQEREAAPSRAAPIHIDAHPVRAVGEAGDRHLQSQGAERDERDEGEHAEVEAELVLDLREQDAEAVAVQLVDGVEAEEHDQREDRAAARERRVEPRRPHEPPRRRPATDDSGSALGLECIGFAARGGLDGDVVACDPAQPAVAEPVQQAAEPAREMSRTSSTPMPLASTCHSVGRNHWVPGGTTRAEHRADG